MRKIIAIFTLVALGLITLLLPLAQMKDLEKKADLTLAWGPEPKTLDPAVATGVIEMNYIKTMFEGLVSYDPQNPVRPIPGVAKSWEISKDQKTYTFHLRKDAKWSNGDAITASDFHYAWKRILNLEVESQYVYMLYYIKNAEPFFRSRLMGELAFENFAKMTDPDEKLHFINRRLRPGVRRDSVSQLTKLIKEEKEGKVKKALLETLSLAQKRPSLTFEDVGIKVIDDYTLEVTLENQTPYILDIFGFPTLLPVPKKAIEAHGENWIKPENIVVNGAFIIDTWQPHFIILLKKNPLYYNREKVKVDQIAAMIIDQPSTALNYYVRGRIDYLDKSVIPTDFVESLMDRKDFIRFENFGTTFLRFNVTKPPFDNPKVRQAFAMALDRKEIVRTMRSGQKASNLLVPPIDDYPQYQPQGLPYDPERARKLLDEVYPDRSKLPKIEYLLSSTGAKSRDLYLVIRKQLEKNLGVKSLELKEQEWQVYLQSLTNKEYHIGYGAWIGDYADPNTFMDMFVTGGGNNRTGWGSDKYDKWIRQAAATRDHQKRYKILAQCEKLLLEEACAIAPLYFRTGYIMVKPKVKGVVPNVMQRFNPKNFWIEKE